jgi:acyl dehydratase
MRFDAFEAVEVGATATYGDYEVTGSEIRWFGRRYDPQPIHTDPAAASESPFDGLVASGWHTAAVTMRLLVDGMLAESGAVGAVGVDDLRWPTPVRPGDRLSIATEVVGTEPGYRPGMGLVRVRVRTETDAGEAVLSMVGRVLFPSDTGEGDDDGDGADAAPSDDG